jgi:hypothetical protein
MTGESSYASKKARSENLGQLFDRKRSSHLKKIDAHPNRKINVSNSENGWDKGLDVHTLLPTGKYS